VTGRLLAQLAEVAIKDAAAVVDPRHTDDDREGMPPTRSITLGDIEESRRLCRLAAELELRAALAGFSACDDPFESEEENERRRVECWDRVLP
jgi:hypothetical protein